MSVIKSDVAKRVDTALAEDERTAEFEIDVVDEQGVVTLTGSVASTEAKSAAEDITEAQAGVIEVINNLEVEETDIGEKIAAPPPDVRGGANREL
jgi:osmotically-inducible protein OsmY